MSQGLVRQDQSAGESDDVVGVIEWLSGLTETYHSIQAGRRCEGCPSQWKPGSPRVTVRRISNTVGTQTKTARAKNR